MRHVSKLLSMPDNLLERSSFLVAGALLAWVLQQYRVLRNEDTALINEHIKDVEKFRDQALEYWLAVPDPKLKDDIEHRKMKDLALAAKVRAAHAATTIPYQAVAALSGSRQAEYKTTTQELYALATGGDFESQRDGIEPERALEIFDSASRLINLLREIRREVISIRRLFASAFTACKRNVVILVCVLLGLAVGLFGFWKLDFDKARPAEMKQEIPQLRTDG